MFTTNSGNSLKQEDLLVKLFQFTFLRSFSNYYRIVIFDFIRNETVSPNKYKFLALRTTRYQESCIEDN